MSEVPLYQDSPESSDSSLTHLTERELLYRERDPLSAVQRFGTHQDSKDRVPVMALDIFKGKSFTGVPRS